MLGPIGGCIGCIAKPRANVCCMPICDVAMAAIELEIVVDEADAAVTMPICETIKCSSSFSVLTLESWSRFSISFVAAVRMCLGGLRDRRDCDCDCDIKVTKQSKCDESMQKNRRD